MGARILNSKMIRKVSFYFLLAVCLVGFMFPFYWMFSTSLKTEAQFTNYPPVWFFTPSLQNYTEVLTRTPFPQYILNSSIIAISALSIALLLGLPAAYSISKNVGQERLTFVLLLARILPAIVYLFPLFILYRKIGLIDTYIGVVPLHVIRVLPLIVLVMSSFFKGLPRELEEAAIIDGCSRTRAFIQIVLPLSKPGIVAVAILSFIYSWNNFIFILILGGPRIATLPLAIYSFISYEEIFWGPLAAAASIIVIPVIVFTILAQQHLVQGLTFGAVKQ